MASSSSSSSAPAVDVTVKDHKGQTARETTTKYGESDGAAGVTTADAKNQPSAPTKASVLVPDAAKVHEKDTAATTSTDDLFSSKSKTDWSAEGGDWEIDSEDPNYTAGDATITCCKCVIL
ncbi:hypothetical protein PV08_00516 [Exophiala spinifera]|uniref:Uncharacterized protein n=1 Tax=Exophiala spinifera TaxID=91928 RepID=A0A0D1YXE3_9EURO|nr:uncharacterized protein PV08_00516 [Exophiala spinifera]KIW19941.1 hypothetical protein PV08_00516 [Exophiala spinifera]